MKARARRHPFELWCRRHGIRPGEPTPAIVSPGALVGWEHATGACKLGFARVNMPSLKTRREAFCIRRRRRFDVVDGDCWYDFYEKEGSSFLGEREFVRCPFCADIHLLLPTGYAESLGLLDVPKRHRYSAKWIRPVLQFRKFPAIARDRISFDLLGPELKREPRDRRGAAQRKTS